MTPRAFGQTWRVYQQGLVDKINQATANTEWAHTSPKEIHIAMSRQPDRAALYNVAAMAHFNHFFFESLRPDESRIEKDSSGEEHTVNARDIPDNLLRDIEQSFDGSIDNLRNAMLDHANAIFGNGFVWLVKYPVVSAGINNSSGLKILCTYNAGSPYSEAYKMRQGVDRTVGGDPVRYAQEDQMYGRARQSYGQPFAGQNRNAFSAPNGLQATPLLCINVWEHMWVLDYGLSPVAKETYTKAWWQTINWDVVAKRHLTR